MPGTPEWVAVAAGCTAAPGLSSCCSHAVWPTTSQRSTGRADVLGLAISLVAALPEKVWFCTRKGYSPWERPKREDVGTHEQGGHCIWYNEPEMQQVRAPPAGPCACWWAAQRPAWTCAPQWQQRRG